MNRDSCHKPLIERARFCPHCGTPVTSSSSLPELASDQKPEPDLPLQPSSQLTSPVPENISSQHPFTVREEGRHSANIPTTQLDNDKSTSDAEQTVIVSPEPTLVSDAEQTVNVFPEQAQRSFPAPVPADSGQGIDSPVLYFQNATQQAFPPAGTGSESIHSAGFSFDASNPALPAPSSTPSGSFIFYQVSPPTTSKSRKGKNKMQPGVVKRPQRSRGLNCALGCLGVLVLLLVAASAGWFLLGRPYAHDIAQAELDRALSSAVNQIPAQASQLPPGYTLAVSESTLNNLIVLNLAPSNPVKQPVTKITPAGVRIEFQIYGLACAISGTPQAQDGKLVAANVTTEGPVSLVMSSQEMATLLNRHLADAQAKIGHPVRQVRLKDHEMNLVLG
ncbi:MAG: zinc ribbon domain-containing protein [Ktedonobacteraceae bacterium]|nr:zinc ribbon domain-containing protein [Ktedonobacteraceae bacterium]